MTELEYEIVVVDDASVDDPPKSSAGATKT